LYFSEKAGNETPVRGLYETGIFQAYNRTDRA